MSSKKKNFLKPLPALSVILCWALISICITIFFRIKVDFVIYAVTFVSNAIVLPGIYLFLELTGKKEVVFDWWNNIPNFAHIGIIIVSVFWTLVLFRDILLGELKKEYDGTK
jgi:hypothetical protein